MSTDYYALKPPITSLKVALEGPHAKVSVFVNHVNCGTLCLLAEDLSSVLRLFSDHDGTSILHAYWGGVKTGTVVEFCTSTTPLHLIDQNAQVIDDYGRLYTINEVLAHQGAGKGELV